MTGLLVAMLAILWMVVLLPVLLKAKENTFGSTSVGTFSRSMRALSSNHAQPTTTGRWVLTPRAPLERPGRRELILRRRRIFVSLLRCCATMLVLGLVPVLRFVLWGALASAVALGGYVAYLISEKKGLPEHGAFGDGSDSGRQHRSPHSVTTVVDSPAPPVRILNSGQRVYRIVDDAVDDDGLSELGWLQAGRR